MKNKEILICATHKQMDYLRSRYGFDLDDLYAQELVTEKIVRDAIHSEGELRVFFVLHPQKSIRQYRKILARIAENGNGKR